MKQPVVSAAPKSAFLNLCHGRADYQLHRQMSESPHIQTGRTFAQPMRLFQNKTISEACRWSLSVTVNTLSPDRSDLSRHLCPYYYYYNTLFLIFNQWVTLNRQEVLFFDFYFKGDSCFGWIEQFSATFSGLPHHGYADGLKWVQGDKEKLSKSSSNLPRHFHADSPAQGSAVLKTRQSQQAISGQIRVPFIPHTFWGL